MRWLLAPGLAAALALTVGTAAAQPPPPGYAPIPAPRYEVVPVAPRPSVVWEPGHWHWTGIQYAWVPGHYVERLAHYHRFVEGHWNWSPYEHRHVWIPAHWD